MPVTKAGFKPCFEVCANLFVDRHHAIGQWTRPVCAPILPCIVRAVGNDTANCEKNFRDMTAPMPKSEELPYRPCVGIMLVNMDGKVFVGQRLDNKVEAWQMPQGGIDDGEEPRVAAIRELGEETGIDAHHVEIIATTREEHFYDLPADLLGKVWGGKFRGQRQIWYLARFTGTNDDINIQTSHPEFGAWKWAAPETLPDLIVPFKKKLYRDVLQEFQDLI